jgi:hypothetical protein
MRDGCARVALALFCLLWAGPAVFFFFEALTIQPSSAVQEQVKYQLWTLSAVFWLIFFVLMIGAGVGTALGRIEELLKLNVKQTEQPAVIRKPAAPNVSSSAHFDTDATAQGENAPLPTTNKHTQRIAKYWAAALAIVFILLIGIALATR